VSAVWHGIGAFIHRWWEKRKGTGRTARTPDNAIVARAFREIYRFVPCREGEKPSQALRRLNEKNGAATCPVFEIPKK